jgi:hypothetical protein
MSVTAALGGNALFCARVAQTRRDSMSYEPKSSRRDHLTSTTKDCKIELTEEQLSRVGGGYKEHGQVGYLKLKIDTFINS